jgi:hypothetical protein
MPEKPAGPGMSVFAPATFAYRLGSTRFSCNIPYSQGFVILKKHNQNNSTGGSDEFWK